MQEYEDFHVIYMAEMPTNEEQFLQAYDALADAIFRHCYFRVFSRERARDLMQEAFTRTWESLVNGQDIKNIRAFLYRVANNLIIDESRKKKTVSLDELHDEGFDAGAPDASHREAFLDGKLALKVLQKLDEKYREVVIMRYIDDMTPKEIAEIVGESENNVSVRIHRGLKMARELLAHTPS